jgi:hypothetical protein
MVATIIATLLIVVIAVIGGTITYAFSNDFFSGSLIAPLQVDAILVDGYDARDTNKLATHAGVLLDTGCSSNSKLATGDIIFVYVDNLAGHPVVIEKVIFAGADYTFDNDARELTKNDDGLSWGQFAITNGVSIETTKTNVVPSGQEVTIGIRYAGDAGDIPIGKSVIVKIVTDNGWAFPISVRNGMHSS